MNRKRFLITAGIGCGILLVLLIIAIPLAFINFFPITSTRQETGPTVETNTGQVAPATQEAIATLTPASPTLASLEGSLNQQQDAPNISSQLLAQLYGQLNPGVVSLVVSVERGGQMGQVSGSGFILDEQGHIVTNNHVIAGAQLILINYFNGIQHRAELIGADVDSDLAIVKVDQLVEGAHPLALGNSDQVIPGEWVLAIGNPFSLNSTMTVGIVSAIGRAIPTGVTPFSIPQAIQTDAAINPGNSGGPLLNLRGEVIGVNAQIATGQQTQANAGVGFAIPSNIVRRVAPVLIEQGVYQWPWLGIESSQQFPNLFLMEANDLNTQEFAYIHRVVNGGPADQAGLQGSEGSVEIDGIETPVGGDVIVEANGEPISDFNDLLAQISFQNPGDPLDLVIIREGERQSITVELEARPENMQP